VGVSVPLQPAVAPDLGRRGYLFMDLIKVTIKTAGVNPFTTALIANSPKPHIGIPRPPAPLSCSDNRRNETTRLGSWTIMFW
jgi:hypothetical protein